MSRRRNKGARDFQLWKSCQRKRAYATREEAFQKGQQVYQCKHCGKWHRSGSLATLAAKLNRRALDLRIL